VVHWFYMVTDMPGANSMTVGVMAAVAQHERELIGAHQGGAGRGEGARHQARQCRRFMEPGAGHGARRHEGRRGRAPRR